MEIRQRPVKYSTHAATGSGLLAIVLWSTRIACSRSMAEQLGAFTSAATLLTATLPECRPSYFNCSHAITVKRLCPHGIFLRPRMEYYAEISDQIRAIFEKFTPLVDGR